MWYQIRVENCEAPLAETLSEALEEDGALAVTLLDESKKNNILEPPLGTTPLWPKVVLEVLYDDPQEAERVKEQLSIIYPDLILRLENIEDEDWERKWMVDFKPQCFGEKLWVCPSWSEPLPAPAVNILLDPGLAFGTGTHPTTALCLKWLDKNAPENQIVLDFGCGSGILSLAALKLGASSVVAVDIDIQALKATEENAERNAINQNQLLIDYPEKIKGKFDLVLANILLSPLLTLGERFHSLLNPGGSLVVSGLLEDQASVLIEKYEPYFSKEEIRLMDNWALIWFVRKS